MKKRIRFTKAELRFMANRVIIELKEADGVCCDEFRKLASKCRLYLKGKP